MSYPAEAYRVMIASPSDVPQERQLVRDVIQEWNFVHSDDRGIVLMPIGWETHSSPVMGDRPQEIINKQVLKNCDLLVAVFWTRIGSPTGASSSGTVEEIEEHLVAGKPTMIYFSSAPVRLDSLNQDQYNSLLEFKKSCMERGLIDEYDSLTEFRQKFSRQLAQTVIRYFSEAEVVEDGTPDQAMNALAIPALTDAACELLSEAAKDANGIIMRIGTLAGFQIQTNKRQFVIEHAPRAEAKWLAAIKELQQLELIEDRGFKGELFQVTNEGYRVADLLSKR